MALPACTSTSMALKEWQLVTDALTLGAAPLLIRKGGIREHHHRFECPHRQALLLPTFEHQNLSAIKPSIQDQFQLKLCATAPTETVRFDAWAEFTHVFAIQTLAHLKHLEPFHSWTAEFITRRWMWKPDRPLWGILCRVYRLPQSVQVPVQPNFGGCRSWVSLPESMDLAGSRALWSNADYENWVDAVLNARDEGRPIHSFGEPL